MLGWLMMALLGTQIGWAGRPSPEAIEARRAEREGSLAVGDTAPTGPLVTLEGEPANLQQFLGDRPTVLIFGSFT